MSTPNTSSNTATPAAAETSENNSSVDDTNNNLPSGSYPPLSSLSSPPSDTPYSTKEGHSHIISKNPTSVFYNPVQVFNRDSSILVIREYVEMLQRERRERWEKRQQKRRLREEKQRKEQQQQKQQEQEGSEATADKEKATSLATSGKNDSSESTATENNSTTNATPQSPPPFKGIRILEALSATGLRSIRYWNEIPNVREIIANDLDEAAVKDIERNVAFNRVGHGVKVSHADANDIMYAERTTSLSKKNEGFDVVDLDPYGTAAPFLDAGLQCVKVGGLLCITCTDLAVLAGNNPGTCYAKYASVPTRGKYCHELALRILLQTIQTTAQKYKRYIEPLYSFHVDFYIRVFVRVHESPKVVKNMYKDMGYVVQCSNCPQFLLQSMGRSTNRGSNQPPVIGFSKHCEQCGSAQKIGGPMWMKPIHNQKFVRNMLLEVQKDPERFATHRRMEGILTVNAAELADYPLFYNLPSLSKAFKVGTPSKYEFRSALINAGYSISKTHCDANAVKTDAPNQVVFDIMRDFAARKRPANKQPAEGTVAHSLMKNRGSNSFFSNFEMHEAARKLDTIAVYFPNPEKNWGPKSRATGGNKKRPREEEDNKQATKKQKVNSEADGEAK